MTSLGQTLSALKSRRQKADGGTPGQPLAIADGFGSNPGNLIMKIHVPTHLPEDAGLVVVMHGCTQTAEGYAIPVGWIELADRFGFVVVAPEQSRANNSNLCFNWYLPGDAQRSGGEAESVAQMVRYALELHDLNAERVFVTGLSAGGAMTAVMLATYPDLFAGGAIIAGLAYGVAQDLRGALAAMSTTVSPPAKILASHVCCATDHCGPWPTVSIWHGTADGLVRPAAGDALADQWREVHGASGSSLTARTPGGREFLVWLSPDGEPVVELHRISGLGHGAAVKSGGDDGCGSASAYTLEVGVSSSFEIALGWGLASISDATRQSARSASVDPSSPNHLPPRRAASGSEVETVIHQALRSAGLMK